MLSGGFIITSLLWASALAMLIDRRMKAAAGFFGVGAVASPFGVIHSPLRGSPLALPWDLPETLPVSAAGQTPTTIAASYALLAALLAVWGLWVKPGETKDSPSLQS
jgi:AGZA family xanthine/uracil permease-like MFS transporter